MSVKFTLIFAQAHIAGICCVTLALEMLIYPLVNSAFSRYASLASAPRYALGGVRLMTTQAHLLGICRVTLALEMLIYPLVNSAFSRYTSLASAPRYALGWGS